MALSTYLVEDSRVIRANLIETLEELADARIVGWATKAGEAEAWLADPAHEWDLLIADLFLEEGSGLSVLSACRDRAPSQYVAVMSNYATPEMRTRCRALGADAVFDKSTEIDALIDFCASLQGRVRQR